MVSSLYPRIGELAIDRIHPLLAQDLVQAGSPVSPAEPCLLLLLDHLHAAGHLHGPHHAGVPLVRRVGDRLPPVDGRGEDVFLGVAYSCWGWFSERQA